MQNADSNALLTRIALVTQSKVPGLHSTMDLAMFMFLKAPRYHLDGTIIPKTIMILDPPLVLLEFIALLNQVRPFHFKNSIM